MFLLQVAEIKFLQPLMMWPSPSLKIWEFNKCVGRFLERGAGCQQPVMSYSDMNKLEDHCIGGGKAHLLN
jgi:hypothetical protein